MVVDDQDSTAKVTAGPSDVELVRAYRAGDIHAFEELHRRYVGSIFRLVRRKLGDALLAEDIAQETFMKALRMMDRVDDTFNFGYWRRRDWYFLPKANRRSNQENSPGAQPGATDK